MGCEVIDIPSDPFELSTFVFKPGGVREKNIYPDWPSLYADLIKNEGTRFIHIEDTLATASIPAGSYALEGVFIGGLSQGSTLTFEEGATLTGFPIFTYFLTVSSDSTTPIYTVNAGESIFISFQLAAKAIAGNFAPFIQVANGGQLVLFMGQGCEFTTGGTVGVGVLDTAPSGIVIGYTDIIATFHSNTITGSGVFFYFNAVGSSQLELPQTFFIGLNSNFLLDDSVRHSYDDIYGVGFDNVQEALDTTILYTKVLKNTYDYVTMTSTGSHTIVADCASLRLHAGGTIALYTVTMPAAPYDGQLILISTDQIVTGFTLNPNSGQSFVGAVVTTLALGQAVRYQWVNTDSKWWPI